LQTLLSVEAAMLENWARVQTSNATTLALEKSRSRRPHTARDLAQLLARCPSARQWSVEEAEEWWSKHERGAAAPGGPSKAAETSQSTRTYEQTMITNAPNPA
jgi:eukaryotic-like serine/threonine-protein kinase